jgi:hypothetical protein
VLDRFQITMHMNQSLDQVRRGESTRLQGNDKEAAKRLKHMRWPLLRRGSKVRGHARRKLNALLASKLAPAAASGASGRIRPRIFSPLTSMRSSIAHS